MERDKLLGTMDAKVWTDEFMATKDRLGDEEFDHTMMLSWFANAIMAGFDEANRRAQRALDAERRERRAVEQIAGQALGYPWFKDDQKNFPGATEADGVCIGEHVAGTIVQELASKLATLQAQLARWKEALGEWLWNCTNLLGDYHIKTVQDFNEEVNRRIAWLMQHLDHTLPPPMTDEERDRMRKLSEDNAALQADNECKDSLIETLQAQLRQVEGQSKQQAEEAVIVFAKYTTLRQLVEALPMVDVQEVSVWLSPDESGWLVSKRPAFPAGLYWAKFRTQAEADSFRALLAYRATLAAKDVHHHTEERHE